MKKIFIFFTVFMFSINVYAMDINSTSAIVYNLNEDKIIYEKDINNKVKIASLTKIMTCLVALENIEDVNIPVTVEYSDLKDLTGYAKAGFKVGDVITYKDLLYALMLPSAADAANILARNIGGTVENFVNMMNDKSLKLGLKNTHFSNPIGMDEDNYSTAYEVSLILKEALNNNFFKELYSTSTYTTSNNIVLSKTTNKTAYENNLDITNLTGSKTGFTNAAGYCFSSTSTYNGVNFLSVTLNASSTPNHIKDTLNLYNYYNENYSYKTILKKNQLLKTIKVKHSKTKEYKIKSKKEINKYLNNDFDSSKLVYKYSGIKKLSRKIKKGEYLGKVKIIYDNEILDIYKVYLDKDIKYYNYFLLLIPVGIIILLIRILKKTKHL